MAPGQDGTLAADGGFDVLMGALREAFARTDESQRADALEEYFFRTKRRVGQDMISYIADVRAAYRKVRARGIQIRTTYRPSSSLGGPRCRRTTGS